MSKRKNKFRPGSVVHTPTELLVHIRRGDWLYLFERPKHPMWIGNMQFDMVCRMLQRGSIRVAEPNV